LALTWLTSGSVGIVRSRTKATEFSFQWYQRNDETVASGERKVAMMLFGKFSLVMNGEHAGRRNHVFFFFFLRSNSFSSRHEKGAPTVKRKKR
jgi:hypothetical protein